MADRPLALNSTYEFKRIADGQFEVTVLPSSYARAAANGLATLDSSGKIPTAQLPPLAVHDTFTVNSQAAQLALVAQAGDLCIRTDINKAYFHNGGVSGTMADWTEIIATGQVVSIFGRTGTVAAANGDYTASQVTNVPAGGVSSITVQAALNELDTEKANLASPTFTGVPAAPTAATGTATTQIATTAFVQSAIADEVTVASIPASITTLDQCASATYRAVWWDLYASKGTALYQTTVTVIHDGSATFWKHIDPTSVGTVDLTWDVDISGGQIRLRLTPATTGWSVHFRRRTLAI